MNPKFISLLAALLTLGAAATAHAQIPQDGLAAYWSFEQPNPLTEKTGNLSTSVFGGVFTSTDTPPTIAGSGSASFDGVDDYLKATSGVLSNYDADHTVAVWFKADNAPSGTRRYVVYESEEFVLSLGLREDPNDSSKTRIQFFTNVIGASDPTVNVSVPDFDIAGKWNHAALVFTRNGNIRTMTAYINRVERGSTTFTTALDLTPFPDFFHIGTARDPDFSPSRYFEGCIDDLAIWSRALDPDEIRLVAHSTPRAVTNTADSGPGSLRQAVIDVPSGTPITFDPNLSGRTITLTSRIGIEDKTIEIDASDLPGGIILSGGGTTGTFTLLDSEATMRGLTFTDCLSSFGAAIHNRDSVLRLLRCDFIGNRASGAGGAIRNLRGSLTLSECTLMNNRAGSGGAIENFGEATISEFGIATLLLDRCTVANNIASSNGGGIINRANGFSPDGSRARGEVTLQSCTFTNNTAGSGRGGAILSDAENAGEVRLNITDSTLAYNRASTGGDVRSDSGTRGEVARVTMRNSLFTSFTQGGQNSSFEQNGFNLFNQGDPKLSPLGDYGGPTPTMHPLAGSFAVDDTETTTRTDQRGFTLTGPRTFGAVKIGPVSTAIVTNEATLRSALAGSANVRGRIIRFDQSLDGQTITLDGTQLTIPATTNGLFIDASDLPDGLTIDAGGQSRVMQVSEGATAALYGLTLTGGKDGSSGGFGGGIFVDSGSSLTLAACTISGNETGSIAGNGGGIFADSDSRLTLATSTVSENQARTGGGIFYSGSRLTISNSTIAGNIALSATGQGGGLYYSRPGVVLTQSIVSENTGESGADIFGTTPGGDIITSSHSYVGDLAGWSSTATPLNLADGSSNLIPLGDYGGPTETMLPLPGSPVVNPAAATASGRITDQRRLSNSGTPDIGAAEFQGRFRYPTRHSLSLGIPLRHRLRRRRQSLRGRIRPRHRSLCLRRRQPEKPYL